MSRLLKIYANCYDVPTHCKFTRLKTYLQKYEKSCFKYCINIHLSNKHASKTFEIKPFHMKQSILNTYKKGVLNIL